MERPAGSPAGLSLPHEHDDHMRIALLIVLAVIVAGCQLIVPPSPVAPESPSLPFPTAEPPRLSPSIEIPPPP